MMERIRGWFAVVPATAVLLAVILLPIRNAQAVDAPKWVAALYVAGQKTVGLRWMPVSGATGYKVLRSTAPGSGYEEIAGTSQPQHFDAAIEPGTTYYYVLQALAGAEVSPNSDEKKIAIPGEKKKEAVKPPLIREVTLTQTTEFGKVVSKIGIFWSAPAGKVVAYNIYRSTTPGKDYQMVTSTNELQHVDTEVEIGKTYYFVVTALDEMFQETPHSAEKSVLVKEPEKKKARKKKEKIKTVFRRCRKVGEFKSGTWGALAQPTGVAMNSNNEIYITDSRNHRVVVFDAGTMEFLFRFGEVGTKDGKMLNPLDLSIDDDDQVYVNNRDGRVTIYSADGQHKDTVDLDVIREGRGEMKGTIGGIECGPDYWYLTDDANHFIYTLEYGRNTVVSVVGGVGDELGQFRVPKKFYYDTARNVLVVADMFNFRIDTLSADDPPEPLTFFGTYGNSVTQFDRVIDVAPDGMGNILAIDFGNQTTQAFDFDGKFQYVLSTEDGTEQLPMTAATGILFRDNRLYITASLSSKVDVWELTDEIGRPVKTKKK